MRRERGAGPCPGGPGVFDWGNRAIEQALNNGHTQSNVEQAQREDAGMWRSKFTC